MIPKQWMDHSVPNITFYIETNCHDILPLWSLCVTECVHFIIDLPLHNICHLQFIVWFVLQLRSLTLHCSMCALLSWSLLLAAHRFVSEQISHRRIPWSVALGCQTPNGLAQRSVERLGLRQCDINATGWKLAFCTVQPSPKFRNHGSRSVQSFLLLFCGA